jgi:dCMP deaminase
MSDFPLQPSFEETIFRDVYNYANRSKDPRTRIGAVILNKEKQTPFSFSWNGFPRKFKDAPQRWSKENKNHYVCHAESNGIANCSRHGYQTEGAVLASNGVPCELCSRLLCNSGIKEIWVHKQWQDWEKKFGWNDKYKEEYSMEMFNELNIPVVVFDKELGLDAYLDGKIINV